MHRMQSWLLNVLRVNSSVPSSGTCNLHVGPQATKQSVKPQHLNNELGRTHGRIKLEHIIEDVLCWSSAKTVESQPSQHSGSAASDQVDPVPDLAH